MLRHIKSVRREINALVIGSFVLLLLKVLWLNSTPEIFQWGHEIGEIVDRLSASILSSYIFFLIVVHLKSERDKETVNPYVSGRVKRIIGDCKGLLADFQKVSGVELNLDKLQRIDIEKAFKVINPKDQAPLILGLNGQHADWLQYMDSRRKRTIQGIEKIFRKITFLDSQLVQHLASIDDCSHFSILQDFPWTALLKNTTLEAWAGTFFDYCVLIRELEKYEKSKLAAYSSGL